MIDGPAVTDPLAPPPDLRAVLEESWAAPPGQPDSRIPVDEAGLAAVEAALPSPLPPELQPIADAVVWGRGSRPMGGAAAFGAVCVSVATGVLWRATGSPALLTAATVWFLAAAFQLRYAAEPQLVANARRVAGERTLDEAFLQFLADGPPLLAPFGLLGRAAVQGALAPLTAPIRIARNRRPALAAVSALALVFVAVAGLAWAPEPPPPTPQPEPSVPLSVEPTLQLGGQTLSLWPTEAQRAAAPFLLPSTPDRVLARLDAAPDAEATLVAGLAAGLGPPTSSDVPAGDGCTAALHTWDGDRSVRLRLRRCGAALDVEAWAP